MTTNIFEVVIGRDQLRWDAVWRVIEWLAEPAEGHALERQFQAKLSEFCLGTAAEPIAIEVEYYLGKDADDRSRHPDLVVAHPDLRKPKSIALIDDLGVCSPNSMRKIRNLLVYAEMSASKFPNADRRIVVITDTTQVEKFVKLNEAFASNTLASLSYLPLQVIGSWISEMGRPKERIVEDFVEWSTSL